MIRQKTLVRRHQIIEATRTLITTGGMERVTMDAIADEVGLTEGAIYRHFVSKRQILSALVADIETTLLDTVQRAQTEGASAVENLERVLDAHLSDIEGRRAVSFIVIAQAMGFSGMGLNASVSGMFTRYLDSIQAIVRQGIGEGSVRPEVDTDAAATAFFGLIQSTATLWALNNYEAPLAEFRAQMWDLYRRGLASSA
jgi:AcrR family transcriptional regulator